MRRAILLSLLIASQLLRAELPPFVEKLAPNVWAGGWGAKEEAVNVVWYVSGGRTYLIGDQATAVDTAAISALTGKPVDSSRTGQPGVEVIAPGVYFLKTARILFAGDLITNGPRSAIQPDIFVWLAQLDKLSALQPLKVVPGKGSWTGPGAIGRQRRFVREIFRQVAFGIAMERPLASIQSELLIPASHLVWMPYDTPSPEDVTAVYRQLTAPVAPIWRTPTPGKKQALVLIGDRFHEPEHFLDTLRPVIESTGVETQFIVDYRALTRENLARVDLLIILRDGMVWPAGPQGAQRIWMTPAQEQAVEDFVVKDGKAFLNLHNSMGIYPEGGKYLRLVGGRYIGHGPLERYHVEVSDPTHPIAQGVTNWFAADEQHTPPADIPVKVFLTNRSPDGKVKANAGWTHEPGKGRVCHFAPGHTRESLLHPMFQRTLRNAVEWCLRRR